jgi:GT2 family glycosyltransferase
MARRSAIDQVGLLDETFFMNSEELDWCYRMWYGGWQVWYVPEAEVVHVGGASADRRSARQRMRLYEGKARFVQKHYGGLAAFIVRMTFRVASLTKVVAYQTLYIATGNRTMKMQATSHWPVVWSRAWA